MPFEAGVKEAGAYSVMPSYNEVDGIPSHVSRWLLEDVLRREWGFQGLVASDYYAIEQLVSRHHVARDKADAAQQSLEAGVDIELPDPDGFPSLVAMVKDGRVAEADVDRAAVARAPREVPRRPLRAAVRQRRRGRARHQHRRAARRSRSKRRASRSCC